MQKLILFCLMILASNMIMGTHSARANACVSHFAVLRKEPDTQLRSWTSPVTSYQNVTLSGDIVVESGTYLIESMELRLIGKIVARNNATVVVRNAQLILVQEGAGYREAVRLENASNFIIENATIIFQPLSPDLSYVTVNDSAHLNITGSMLCGWTYVVARNTSEAYMKNSTFEGDGPLDRNDFGVYAEDKSFVRIQDSKLYLAGASGRASMVIQESIIQPYGVTATEDATIEIENSDVGYCQLIWENSNLHISNSMIKGISFQGSTLHVRDSQIESRLRTSGNCTVWLIGTSVPFVDANDESKVWLINSAAEEIITRDEAMVYLGWQLPLLGTVALPYTWIPILQWALGISVVIIVVVVIVLIHKRWRSKGASEWEYTYTRARSLNQRTILLRAQTIVFSVKESFCRWSQRFLVDSEMFLCRRT